MDTFSGFADFYGQTQVHPLALSVIVLLIIAVFVTAPKFSLVPLFITAAIMPVAQRIVIGGADFTLLRLLLLAYVLRITFRGEWVKLRWHRLDWLVILWVISGSLIMIIHHSRIDVAINRAGWAYDILLVYLCTRVLIRGWEEVLILARTAVIISIPMAVFFITEWLTQYNVFHVFGGVREITWEREGRLRCQGPYAHPIIAGAFWAAILPLIWTLWHGEGKSRRMAVVGTLTASVIILASASSTPILSAVAAGLGAALFMVRQHRTRIWVGLFGVILLLHFVIMKAPVWHLISRVSVTGGSTGWHRYIIFDTFINHFSEWYLTGYSTPTDWLWHMRDITNQYIIQGLDGGLLTLALFAGVLTIAFGNIGRALKERRGANPCGDDAFEWRIWLIGVAVFVHVVSFWGLGYFGQMSVLWYLQLSLAGAVGAGVLTGEASVRDSDRAVLRRHAGFARANGLLRRRMTKRRR